MEEVGRNPASIIPLWRDFVDEGGGRTVRGIGEPVWAARGAAALDECRRHESLLNVAFAPAPAWSLLCPYDAGSLPDEALEKEAAAAERAGMDQLGIADLVTATSELAANSVMHGGGSGTLRLRPGIRQEGGRGLWLANQLCDLVQIRSGARGTTCGCTWPPARAPSSEACRAAAPGSGRT